MEVEQLLKQLGFEVDPKFSDGYTRFWNHPQKISVMVLKSDTVELVAQRIFMSGYQQCQKDMKKVLGIGLF